MWDQATKDRNWQPPIGDTSTNAGKRLELLIDNLLESGERDFLLVTHGGITTDFLRNIYSDSELVEYTNDSRLSVEDNIGECSVTIMKIDSDSKIKLVDFACINHLK
jgi:broad specificity phosphatase PhoE